MRADILLIGFGNVARRFAQLLDQRREVLRREHDLECRIVGCASDITAAREAVNDCMQRGHCQHIGGVVHRRRIDNWKPSKGFDCILLFWPSRRNIRGYFGTLKGRCSL